MGCGHPERRPRPRVTILTSSTRWWPGWRLHRCHIRVRWFDADSGGVNSLLTGSIVSEQSRCILSRHGVRCASGSAHGGPAHLPCDGADRRADPRLSRLVLRADGSPRLRLRSCCTSAAQFAFTPFAQIVRRSLARDLPFGSSFVWNEKANLPRGGDAKLRDSLSSPGRRSSNERTARRPRHPSSTGSGGKRCTKPEDSPAPLSSVRSSCSWCWFRPSVGVDDPVLVRGRRPEPPPPLPLARSEATAGAG